MFLDALLDLQRGVRLEDEGMDIHYKMSYEDGFTSRFHPFVVSIDEKHDEQDTTNE